MTKKKREDIQSLRAVAIIMVLLFHFYPSYFPNGYVGVDMFFVISGFIIAMVFPKEWNRANIVDFYYRRVKRIFPLYFSVIFVFLVAITLLAPDNFVQVNLNSGKRAVLFTSNIMSAQSAELGYERLIAKADDLFTHCWSLCLEIQWYLFAPALFFFTTFRLTACQAVFVLSGFYYYTANESVAFNSVFARLWQFIAGIVAHDLIKFAATENLDYDGILLVSSKLLQTDSAKLNILSNISAPALLLGFLPSVPCHPTVLRVVITVATAALLMSGSVVKVPLLSTSLFSWIGNISYSLYLAHWPIFITAKNMDFPLDIEIGLCLSVVVAAFLYQYFEMSYLSWEKITILLFVVSMFSASLFIIINGMGIRRRLYNELSPEEIMMEQNRNMPWLAINIAEGGLQNTSGNLGSPLCKYDQMFEIASNPPMGRCEMPKGNGSHNILVLGNSWASNQGPNVIYDAFKHLANEFNVYSMVGCEPLQTSQTPYCIQYANYGKQAVDYFKPHVLIIIQRSVSVTPISNLTEIDHDPIFIELLEHLRFYESKAKKIYIQQALPWCSGPCTTQVVNKMRAEGKNLSEIGDQFIERDQFARSRMTELAKRCKNCEIIDFLPYYDLATNGLPVPYDLDRNLILLDDNVHLNKFGKERVRPLFEGLKKMCKKKREDIQALRALAIIMVVLTHFYPSQFPNGYVGLDMFFVISGFVISMVFPKEWNRSTVIDFYYRRVKRILPLYFSFILCSLHAVIFFAPWSFVQENLDSGRRAALFITNVMSPEVAQTRFQRLFTIFDDIFPHTWSLCLEVQWYFLAPLVFLFSSYRLTVCKGIAFPSFFYFCTAIPSTAFHSVFARLWEFMLGIMAHNFSKFQKTENNDENGKSLNPGNRQTKTLIILNVLVKTIVLALLLAFTRINLNRTILRLLVTVATSAILMSGSGVNLRILNNHFLSWTGNISYSLYLIHWPLCIMAKHVGFTFRFEIGIILSFILASLVYQYFEKNYLSWGKKTILLFVVGMFASTLYVSYDGMRIRKSLYNELTPEEKMTKINKEMPWLALNIAAGGLQNSTDNMGGPLCKYGTLFGIPTNPPLGHCSMPDGNGTENILVLGNSWAANQGPSIIYEAFKNTAKKFDVYSIVGCEPLQISPFCKQWPDYGKLAVEYFKPDVLFIMHRVISATAPFNTTEIDKDPLFNEFMDHVHYYEKFAKKIYIQQALPWCTGACTTSAVNVMRNKGKNLTEIGDNLILRDDYYPRLRIAEVVNRCKKCQVIDFLPYYPLATSGLPVPYDLERNLVLLDDQVHLNQFGKAHMQPLFYDLASNFPFE